MVERLKAKDAAIDHQISGRRRDRGISHYRFRHVDHGAGGNAGNHFADYQFQVISLF
jgi:hypothetical protein